MLICPPSEDKRYECGAKRPSDIYTGLYCVCKLLIGVSLFAVSLVQETTNEHIYTTFYLTSSIFILFFTVFDYYFILSYYTLLSKNVLLHLQLNNKREQEFEIISVPPSPSAETQRDIDEPNVEGPKARAKCLIGPVDEKKEQEWSRVSLP